MPERIPTDSGTSRDELPGEVELLPCPFACVSDIGHQHANGGLRLVCMECGATGPDIEGNPADKTTWERAIAAWNRRHTAAPVTGVKVRKAIGAAIFDPGATEGHKGDLSALQPVTAPDEELVRALEPFVAYIEARDAYDSDVPDAAPIISYASTLRGPVTRVTFGDFRRIRTALANRSARS